jgi:hypothetical protein
MHVEFWWGSSHLEDWEGAKWIQRMGGSGSYPIAGFSVCSFESLASVTRIVVN